MKAKRNLIIAICFFIFILSIPAITLLKMAMGGIPLDQYKGALYGRFPMIKLNTVITERLTGGSYMESNEVLLGKDGWLFYKVKTDGTPLYDYMGINHFSNEELEHVDNNLKDICSLAEERGFDLAFLTIPNKEQVYEEYMPDTVSKVSEISKLDQLTAHILSKDTITSEELKINGEGLIAGKYPYVDISYTFNALKDSYPLYYKTDTHWTQIGSYIALQKTLENLYGKSQSIESIGFNQVEGFEGDLPRISGTSDRFSENDYVLDSDKVLKEAKKGGILLVIGDSFGDAMLHTAKYYFDEVYHVRIKNYSGELLDEYKPDLVIVECVERYLDDLEQYNIAKM